MCSFLCNYQSKFIRFGFAVLLLVSLKHSSNRVARVVFPIFSLGYMEQTNNTLSGFSLLGISPVYFRF